MKNKMRCFHIVVMVSHTNGNIRTLGLDIDADRHPTRGEIFAEVTKSEAKNGYIVRPHGVVVTHIHEFKNEEDCKLFRDDGQIAYLQEHGPFQHLTGVQALAINQEAIRCRVEACLDGNGLNEGSYLWDTIRDLVGKDDVQAQLESISSDPEIVKRILGFDPWMGEKNG